jgi:hypothetical protein
MLRGLLPFAVLGAVNVAHIATNEMRMDSRRRDEAGPGIVASLGRPIAIEATTGNVVGE